MTHILNADSIGTDKRQRAETPPVFAVIFRKGVRTFVDRLGNVISPKTSLTAGFAIVATLATVGLILTPQSAMASPQKSDCDLSSTIVQADLTDTEQLSGSVYDTARLHVNNENLLVTNGKIGASFLNEDVSRSYHGDRHLIQDGDQTKAVTMASGSISTGDHDGVTLGETGETIFAMTGWTNTTALTDLPGLTRGGSQPMVVALGEDGIYKLTVAMDWMHYGGAAPMSGSAPASGMQLTDFRGAAEDLVSSIDTGSEMDYTVRAAA